MFEAYDGFSESDWKTDKFKSSVTGCPRTIWRWTVIVEHLNATSLLFGETVWSEAHCVIISDRNKNDLLKHLDGYDNGRTGFRVKYNHPAGVISDQE